MNSSLPVGLDEYGSDAELRNVTLFVGYPDALLKLVSVCCIIFIVVGVPGNLITIVSLRRYKQIQNATATFIINLSVADLLFCALVLPLVVFSYWTKSWVHGREMCRMFPMLNYTLVIVSLYTAVAIAINRCVMICHPMYYHRIYTKRNINLMLLALWTFALGIVLLPFFELWGRMSLDPKIGSCTIVPDKTNGNPKKLILTIVFFVACSIIILCYIRILLVVRKSSLKSKLKRPGGIQLDYTTNNTCNIVYANCDDSTVYSNTDVSDIENVPQNSRFENVSHLSFRQQPNRMMRKLLPSKKDKKLRTMVCAIMLCLFICYVPVTIVKLLYKNVATSPILNIIGYILVYSAPCINPVLYVFMSKEYRAAYSSLFKFNKCNIISSSKINKSNTIVLI